MVPEYCAESHEFVISNECPSSEWQFIQDYATILANAVPQHLSGTELEISGPRHSQLSGKNSHRQFAAVRKWFSSDEDINPIIMTGRASTTQQAAISDALEVTAKLWENAISSADSRGGHGSIPFDHQIAAHSISDDYFQPYTIATCIIDTILGSDDQRPLAIPITAGINYGADQSSLSYLGFANSSLPKELGHSTLIEAPAIEYPSIVRAGLHQLPGPKSNTRVEWFELPRNLFANSSIGVVILLPSNLPVSKRSESTTNMLVCNVAAGWGNSVLNATTFRGSMSATSSLVIIDDLVLPRGKSELLADSVISPFQSLNDIDISFFMPFFPSKPVGISKKWAEYLNPWIPASNLTLIDSLVKNLPWNNTHQIPLESLGELILSSLVTNGLARVGFNSQLQGNLRWTGDGEERRPNGKLWYSGKGDVFTVDTEESKNWVKLRVNSVLKGYAYNCNGTPPKVAVAFLLTYCTLAIAHYFYSGISGMDKAEANNI